MTKPVTLNYPSLFYVIQIGCCTFLLMQALAASGD
jgi:hypothetical protein